MSIIAFFAIFTYLQSVISERSAEELKKLSCLFVRVCGSYEADIHSANLLYLIVLDFGEYELLLKTESIVSSTVECVGVDTLEVTNSQRRQDV